jgi:hypothetical protein
MPPKQNPSSPESARRTALAIRLWLHSGQEIQGDVGVRFLPLPTAKASAADSNLLAILNWNSIINKVLGLL